jgi:hypothetical protein
MVQEAYNDFKRDLNSIFRQVTLFYYKFRDYEIKPVQPDRTQPCRSRRRKEKLEVQAKLL